MANEITVTGSLSYANLTAGIAAKVLSLLSKSVSITGVNYIQGTFKVPTTSGGTVLPGLSSLASVGWGMFINHDATNFVDLLTAASTGTAFARLKPGECALFRLTPAMTAPAAKSDTAICDLEYLVLEN